MGELKEAWDDDSWIRKTINIEEKKTSINRRKRIPKIHSNDSGRRIREVLKIKISIIK